MGENYIMLNGKRVDLTDEQLEKLGLNNYIDDCFELVKNKTYYSINGLGEVVSMKGSISNIEKQLYSVANYCTDKKILKQRALHEILDRLLWRFSMQNDGDKIDWSDYNTTKYRIYFDNENKGFSIDSNQSYIMTGCTYFNTIEIAQRAIDEIILPFIKKHPDFVW